MYGTATIKPTRGIRFDFRSDTVTTPTPKMLENMITAEVGDDVKNEDPTVHRLQEKVAQLCKKEAGLYVCSGNMSNQLALRTHVTINSAKDIVCQTIIADARSHIFKYELGGASFHSGTQIYPVKPENPTDLLTADVLEKYFNFANDLHTPITSIIVLENTLNGMIHSIDEIKKIKALADKHKISLHLDGARLWNACAETGIPMHEYAQYFDTISLCLSKGLGAPIGSVLVGPKDFIEKARQYKKLFGGGWRQAGVIAQAGIYAIDNHWPLMKQDHENARLLQREMAALGFEGIVPETNMVFLNSSKLGIPWQDIVKEIRAKNESSEEKILVDGQGWDARFVLHHQIPQHGVELLVSTMKEILPKLKSTQSA